MASATSIFWLAGFILSVVIGPQLRIWTWGPTMLCLALSTLFALPVIWKDRVNRIDMITVLAGALLVMWLGIRASVSPVVEFAQADTLLVAMSVATFVAFRAMGSSTVAQRILIAGIACLTAAHLFVLFQQVSGPTYSPIFANRTAPLPSGFYGHYSYGASYLIAVSCIMAAAALHAREKVWVRILFGIIGVLGIFGIYYTRSRGAIIGAAAGFVVLALYTMIAGKRDGKWWFGPLVIAVPVIVLGIGFILYQAWAGAEVARSGNADGGEFNMMGMMDNSIRFFLMGIAVSCFEMHPLLGGGARSFSWECYRFWDNEAMGQGIYKPEHVHNELLQTATEYGIIGVSLLIIFLVCVIVAATFRISSAAPQRSTPYSDAWKIGGLAGFAGLFVHSNFEGIFRIAPGAILLALCLSAASFPKASYPDSRNVRWLCLGTVSLLAIAAVTLLAVFGWKGTLVSRSLWVTYFGNSFGGSETRIYALGKAIEVWPMHSLVHERGIAYQEAAAKEISEESSRQFIELALSDYRRASELHPYDPGSAVAAANLLGSLHRDAQADAEYKRALRLQGGMEGAFQAHFHFARHLHQKALREYDPEKPAASLASLEVAVRHVEEAFKTSGGAHNNIPDRMLRVRMHEDYGRALEASGQFRDALAQYDFNTSIPTGWGSHYNAALLFGRLAVSAWSERRSEDALYLFLQASQRAHQSSEELPSGISAGDKVEYIAYLKRTIDYLKGAKVTPSEKVNF